MVTDLVQNVVRVSSNLIGDKNHQSWIDLGRDEAGQAATSLMVAVEENAFLLADSVTSEKIIIKPTENIREYKAQKLSNSNYVLQIQKRVGGKPNIGKNSY
jgi:hypothetical protein